MKKIFTILMLAMCMSISMKAGLWLIGDVSPYGWDPSRGVEMTSTDEMNYSAEVELSTGDKWFSFTARLGSNSSDWSINDYRWGGSDITISLGTPTTLYYGTDASPKINISEAGIYCFEINTPRVCAW